MLTKNDIKKPNLNDHISKVRTNLSCSVYVRTHQRAPPLTIPTLKPLPPPPASCRTESVNDKLEKHLNSLFYGIHVGSELKLSKNCIILLLGKAMLLLSPFISMMS